MQEIHVFNHMRRPYKLRRVFSVLVGVVLPGSDPLFDLEDVKIVSRSSDHRASIILTLFLQVLSNPACPDNGCSNFNNASTCSGSKTDIAFTRSKRVVVVEGGGGSSGGRSTVAGPTSLTRCEFSVILRILQHGLHRFHTD